MKTAFYLNVTNNSLFGTDRKEEFLNDMLDEGRIQERTAVSYGRIFEKTGKIEKTLNKDLSDFTFTEIESVLRSFKSNNRNTIESYARIISSYLHWNVKQGYRTENVMENMRPDDFQKYLTNEEAYLTERRLRRYENDCENAQDAVIFRLLFEGLGGKELSEIRNLKRSDIDFENRLININDPEDDGRVESIKVSQYTIDLIQKALDQKIYQKKNGNMDGDGDGHVRAYTDLVQNDYVVRASITKNKDLWSPVDKHVIHRRIKSISKSLEIPHFTAKYVSRSGQLHYAMKIMEGEELTPKELKKVAKRFNMTSYHNLKGYLTADNIRKTYTNKKDIERAKNEV